GRDRGDAGPAAVEPVGGGRTAGGAGVWAVVLARRVVWGRNAAAGEVPDAVPAGDPPADGGRAADAGGGRGPARAGQADGRGATGRRRSCIGHERECSMTTQSRCLRCKGTLPLAQTGRPHRYCTSRCRQAAHRRRASRSVHFSSKTPEWATPPD